MERKMTHSEAGYLGALKSTKTWKEKKSRFVAKYNENPKKCKNCQRHFAYEKRRNKFCNTSCAASFNNRGIQRNVRDPIKCLHCKKETKNVKFCCHKCFSDFRQEETFDKIRRGEYIVPYSGSRTLRSFMVQERGKCCDRCNLSTWQNQDIPLSVHHKDGDARNNLPTNLELLCLNCHGLTENFGCKNKNSTRTYRYKRRGL